MFFSAPVRDVSRVHDFTHYEAVETQFKQLIGYADPPGMFDGCYGILDDKLDVEICPYLVQHYPEIVGFGIGEHDKLEPGGGLVVVELVFGGAVRQEALSGRVLSVVGYE